MKSLAWSILLFIGLIIATAYFGGRSLYYWGYGQGQASYKCGRAQCMQHYDRCDFTKKSNYPKLSSYKGRVK